MSYRLFLDDIRTPEQAANYMPVPMNKEYRVHDWVVVRNYDEFVACIKQRGLPTHISFDHDIAPEHYTPEEYWSDYEASKAFQDSREYKEKNGYECAVWLCSYLAGSNSPMPVYYIHSMNPVGADNIRQLLNSYEKHLP